MADDRSPSQSGKRLRLALDMFEAGERIMRTQLRRRHPDISQDEIEELLLRWLSERPGAELGDSAQPRRSTPVR